AECRSTRSAPQGFRPVSASSSRSRRAASSQASSAPSPFPWCCRPCRILLAIVDAAADGRPTADRQPLRLTFFADARRTLRAPELTRSRGAHRVRRAIARRPPMSFHVQPSPPARPNRCQLFGPGSRPAIFPKMAASAADVISMDLEDAVAPGDKEQARDNIVEALNTVDFGAKTVSVRINGL